MKANKTHKRFCLIVTLAAMVAAVNTNALADVQVSFENLAGKHDAAADGWWFVDGYVVIEGLDSIDDASLSLGDTFTGWYDVTYTVQNPAVTFRSTYVGEISIWQLEDWDFDYWVEYEFVTGPDDLEDALGTDNWGTNSFSYRSMHGDYEEIGWHPSPHNAGMTFGWGYDSTLSISNDITGARPAVPWNNPNGGSWGQGDNWKFSNVPQAVDSVSFDLGGAYTVDIQQNRTVDNLTVESGTVTLTGSFTEDVQVNGTVSGQGNLMIENIDCVATAIDFNGNVQLEQEGEISPNAQLQTQGVIRGNLAHYGGLVKGVGSGLEVEGTVSGNGDYEGKIIVSGILSPSHNSLGHPEWGSVEFQDLVLGATSETVFDVRMFRVDENSVGRFGDQIDILGTGVLEGRLDIQVDSLLYPGTYKLIGCNDYTGQFDSWSITHLGYEGGETLDLELMYLSNGVYLKVVPEPGTMALLGLGGMALSGRRRR